MNYLVISDIKGVNMEYRQKCPFRKRVVNRAERGNMSTAMHTISEENFLNCIGEQCQAYNEEDKNCRLCKK